MTAATPCDGRIETAVVFDVDGPLLDTAERQHRCYARILAALGAEALGATDFWERKRAGETNADILVGQQLARLVPAFRAHWVEQVECEELLQLDVPYPQAGPVLRQLRAQGRALVAVTLRQNAAGVHAQLERMGLADHFTRLIVIPHAEGAAGKAHRVQAACHTPLLWIGDTEIDITAARIVGCPVAAITTGIRSRERLSSLAPDWIIDALSEVLELPPLKTVFCHA